MVNVIGYRPGRASANGANGGWKASVLRVTCGFESDSGGLVRFSVGTGFVLEKWPTIVLTARHVVVRPPAIEPARMSVVVGGHDGTAFVEVNAMGVAYPSDPRWDVAALLIEDEAPFVSPVAEPLPQDGQRVHGVSRGFVNGAAPLVELASRVERTGSLLRELDKPSVGGMSGGPVSLSDATRTLLGVMGIQSRDHLGQGLATLLEFRVLDACVSRARSFLL